MTKAPSDAPLHVTLPRLNDTMQDGHVRFLKRPGEAVRRDEPLLEVDTDKVTIELTAPVDGVLLHTRGDGEVRVGDELYTLHPGLTAPDPPPAPPRPAPPPAPAPRTPDLDRPPGLLLIQTTWSAAGLLARARADTSAADPLHLEAALLWTAIVRALVAVPALFTVLVDPRSARVALRHCDVLPEGLRWSHGDAGPGDSSAAVLSALRPGPGPAALVNILRLHGSTPLAAWPELPRRNGLSLVIGPAIDTPVADRGAVVLRPTASLTASTLPPRPADEMTRLAAALGEQLGAL